MRREALAELRGLGVVATVASLTWLLVLGCERPAAPLAAARKPLPIALAERSPAATLPNVVIIFVDDMRADILPYLPNVQKYLVDSGVTFTKAFDNSPLCCPSRASLLSGLQQHGHGVRGNSPPFGGAVAFRDQTTLATDLKARGYKTALIGKYLNGYPQLGPGYVPPGWDEWRAYVNPHYNGAQLVEKAWDSTAVRTNSYSGYSPGVLRQRVATFLQRVPASSPLFLLFTPYAPHREVQGNGSESFPVAAVQDVGACGSVAFPGWSAAFDEADVSDKPAYVQAAPRLTAAKRIEADSGRITQCEAMQSVDRTVGDIVRLLDQTGRLQNSLIVFASDNGYLLGEHRLLERKAAMYDEAIRTPLVIRGLGARLAALDTNLVQVVDLTATVRVVAGLPQSAGGRDLRPTLSVGSWTTDAVLVEMDNAALPDESFTMVRTHDYAYAEYPSGGAGRSPFVELYDLRVDPAETVNVASVPSYASTVQTLAARLALLRSMP